MRQLIAGVLLASGVLLACDGGGSDREPPPARVAAPVEVAGLDALPGDVALVVGFNVGSLARSALVGTALRLAAAQGVPVVREGRALLAACGLAPRRDLGRVLIGVDAGRRRVIAVVTGAVDATATPACVTRAVAAGGGAVDADEIGGRPGWHVRPGGGGPSLWFAFGGPRTLVLASDRSWLRAALAGGAKVSDDPALMGVLMRADRTAGVWLAGRAGAAAGSSFAQLTRGRVEAPARFVFANVDLRYGLRARAGAIMASKADAAATAAFLRSQLGPATMLAQGVGLGGLVGKIHIDFEDDTVFLRLRLSKAQSKEMISLIDTVVRGE